MQRGAEPRGHQSANLPAAYPITTWSRIFLTQVLAENGKLVSLLRQGQEIPGQAMQPAHGRQFSLATTGL